MLGYITTQVEIMQKHNISGEEWVENYSETFHYIWCTLKVETIAEITHYLDEIKGIQNTSILKNNYENR